MKNTLHTPGLSLYDSAGVELSRNITECLLGSVERAGTEFQRSVRIVVSSSISVAAGQILVLSNRDSGEVNCAFTVSNSQSGRSDRETIIEGVMTVGRIAPSLDKTQLMNPRLLDDK